MDSTVRSLPNDGGDVIRLKFVSLLGVNRTDAEIRCLWSVEQANRPLSYLSFHLNQHSNLSAVVRSCVFGFANTHSSASPAGAASGKSDEYCPVVDIVKREVTSSSEQS